MIAGFLADGRQFDVIGLGFYAYHLKWRTKMLLIPWSGIFIGLQYCSVPIGLGDWLHRDLGSYVLWRG
jgi:hypothetical protein